MTTGLPQTLAALASSLVVARSLLLIGSLQLLLLAAAAAALAARLLASQREEETALLSARGVARAQLVLASLAEAALLAVAGAAAGIVLGSYLAGPADVGERAARPPAPRAGCPAWCAAASPAAPGGPPRSSWCWVIIVVMWPALRPVTPGRRPAPAGPAGRARHRGAGRPGRGADRPGGAGVLGTAPVLGGARGCPGARSASTRCWPWRRSLALAGIALLPLRLLPAAARLLDRLSARGRRLAAALASWQVSRRPVREGSPVLLVVLAVATGTLVLAQHQSWRQSQLDQAAFAAGADVTGGPGRAASARPGRDVRAAPAACSPRCRSARSTADSTSGPRRHESGEHGAAPAGPVHAAAGRALAADHPGHAPARAWRCPGRPGPAGHRRHASGAGAAAASARCRRACPCRTAGASSTRSRPGPCPPTAATTSWSPACRRPPGRPRYPLRLLGMSLSYQLPGFPPPPYPAPAAQRAAQQRRARAAAARATLAIRALAVSARASGGFPAPFAAGGRAGPVARRGVLRGPRQPAGRRASSRPSPPGGSARARPR